MDNQGSSRATLIAVVIVGIMIIVGVVVVFASRPQPVAITINPPLPTATDAPTNTPAPITVYVTGAVNQPGTLVTLPKDSRVQDALAQAGGTTDDADLEKVNLAGIVRDGDQIDVPTKNETVAMPTASGGGIVYINTATLEEIMSLPDIGESTAQAIIAYRDANGGIKTLEELDNIDGIGAKTLEKIAPLVSFE